MAIMSTCWKLEDFVRAMFYCPYALACGF